MLLLIYALLRLFAGDSEIVQMASDLQLKYGAENKRYVVIIDYGKPIDEERLYVADMMSCKIILKSTVSHGVNSGKEYATRFSDIEGSLQSSLGAYITEKEYIGQYGKSLGLRGIEKGINSNAKKRHIVFHSSKKMSTKWSWGCFATPEETNRILIGLIKEGCLVYVLK